MAEKLVPYVTATSTITKVLDKIEKAATPEKFTQDFLADTLGIKGGNGKPLIPFLKRTGFIESDGSPTDLYKEYRNDSKRGAAAARALRTGFAPLYQVDEAIHDADDATLKGVVVQVTGSTAGSTVAKGIVGSFKALAEHATFGDEPDQSPSDGGVDDAGSDDGEVPDGVRPPVGLSLGYTINLQLPATSDVAVFNAIFKSLRDHLLR